jgi:hypothetical protein
MKSILSMKLVPNMSWSVGELEDLTPFEKDAYMLMTQDHLKKLAEKQQNGQR